jgi:hypothetical protein
MGHLPGGTAGIVDDFFDLQEDIRRRNEFRIPVHQGSQVRLRLRHFGRRPLRGLGSRSVDRRPGVVPLAPLIAFAKDPDRFMKFPQERVSQIASGKNDFQPGIGCHGR